MKIFFLLIPIFVGVGAGGVGRRRSSGVQGRRVGEEVGGEGELGPKNNYMILWD